MNRRQRQQLHFAVKPRAGIPARRLRAVFEQHDKLILSDMQRLGDLTREGAVPVGPEADLASVDQHLRLAHRTVEEQHITPPGQRIDWDCPAVAPLADVGQAARASGFQRGGCLPVLDDGDLLQVVLAREGPADSPIVRHGHRLPAVGLFKIVIIAKLPVGERFFAAQALRMECDGCRERQQRKEKSIHGFSDGLFHSFQSAGLPLRCGQESCPGFSDKARAASRNPESRPSLRGRTGVRHPSDRPTRRGHPRVPPIRRASHGPWRRAGCRSRSASRYRRCRRPICNCQRLPSRHRT